MTVPTSGLKGKNRRDPSASPSAGPSAVPNSAEVRNPYWCLIGGKAHHAFVQPNIGANVWWCARHGFLMSEAGCLVTGEDRRSADRPMSGRQYDRFMKAWKGRR